MTVIIQYGKKEMFVFGRLYKRVVWWNKEAFCSVCGLYFSLGHGGKSAVKDHIRTGAHATKLTVASTSKGISTFMIKQDTPEDILIRSAELTTAYRVVKHHESFNSLDCTTKLNSVIYPDSNIASKQSTARTKATAIIKNVLAPHPIEQVKAEIENVAFYGVSTDSSNHKDDKMFPLLIQYFTEKEGLQIKLLKLDILPNDHNVILPKNSGKSEYTAGKHGGF